ncbi:Peroxyureidoacrylate/ureidoacrylate amidohydrolase RutB [Cyphellophora attinorum]|uniref:Peroxyureidoacrylate/ureidoacrylate amidohydrolase RutB n=1 Tax=Cyphellophora attinorum TaxID=1664694 RepID=A0A0N1P1A7_9EURO|nr:Peroxyureidoacrylate/ureidoacrylate amidohydrolase RutB [Phialophora attinorum]KPI40407.1 Peroxyureidoacrylate/ureidoacrylate amidohydrolase RutB [Phialophora attinorum]
MIELDSAPALVIIDMQNGFCHTDGSFAKMGITTDPAAIIPHINRLRSAFHAANMPVFFVRTAYNADYSNRRPHDRGDSVERLAGLLRGSWDAEMIDELRPGAGEEVIDKNRNSAFLGTCDLHKILKERGVNHLIMTGVGTDVCVESTARDAYQMDYHVTVVSDATWTCTEADHLAALHALRLFGGSASTSEVVVALEKLGK